MGETEHKAKEAHAAMVTASPMPAAIALDMVQDVTGDRGEAVRALAKENARWATEQRAISDRVLGELLAEADSAEATREPKVVPSRAARTKRPASGNDSATLSAHLSRFGVWPVLFLHIHGTLTAAETVRRLSRLLVEIAPGELDWLISLAFADAKSVGRG